MPLYIKSETTTAKVNRLAKRRGLSKQEAVERAVDAELAKDEPVVTMMQKLQKLWAENPMPPPTGDVADKAFFDELSGDL
jgi:antitoxin VapB